MVLAWDSAWVAAIGLGETLTGEVPWAEPIVRSGLGLAPLEDKSREGTRERAGEFWLWPCSPSLLLSATGMTAGSNPEALLALEGLAGGGAWKPEPGPEGAPCRQSSSKMMSRSSTHTGGCPGEVSAEGLGSRPARSRAGDGGPETIPGEPLPGLGPNPASAERAAAENAPPDKDRAGDAEPEAESGEQQPRLDPALASANRVEVGKASSSGRAGESRPGTVSGEQHPGLDPALDAAKTAAAGKAPPCSGRAGEAGPETVPGEPLPGLDPSLGSAKSAEVGEETRSCDRAGDAGPEAVPGEELPGLSLALVAAKRTAAKAISSCGSCSGKAGEAGEETPANSSLEPAASGLDPEPAAATKTGLEGLGKGVPVWGNAFKGEAAEDASSGRDPSGRTGESGRAGEETLGERCFLGLWERTLRAPCAFSPYWQMQNCQNTVTAAS